MSETRLKSLKKIYLTESFDSWLNNSDLNKTEFTTCFPISRRFSELTEGCPWHKLFAITILKAAYVFWDD